MVECIRADAPEAGLIWLFGSHARGDWVADPRTGYRNDFDPLVVAESLEAAASEARWSRLEEVLEPLATALGERGRDLSGRVSRACCERVTGFVGSKGRGG